MTFRDATLLLQRYVTREVEKYVNYQRKLEAPNKDEEEAAASTTTTTVLPTTAPEWPPPPS